MSSTAESPQNTELFRVTSVSETDAVVFAANFTSRGVMRWVKDTPRNRRREIKKAFDSENRQRVESFTTRQGRRLLLITEVEPVPEGDKIMIDGTKPVVGLGGEEIPAAELLQPGDVIALHERNQDVIVELVDLAPEV